MWWYLLMWAISSTIFLIIHGTTTNQHVHVVFFLPSRVCLMKPSSKPLDVQTNLKPVCRQKLATTSIQMHTAYTSNWGHGPRRGKRTDHMVKTVSGDVLNALLSEIWGGAEHLDYTAEFILVRNEWKLLYKNNLYKCHIFTQKVNKIRR